MENHILSVKNFIQQKSPNHYLCVVGSGAVGDWDDRSDLDLFLVLPYDISEIKKDLLAGLLEVDKSSVIKVNESVIGLALYGELDQRRIDINIFSVAGLKELFTDVLERHRPNISNQRVLAAFRTHKVVSNRLDMSDFLPRHLEYPEELRTNLIRNGLTMVTPPADFFKHRLRGDHLTFSSYLNSFFMRLILMLYALNKLHSGRTKKAAQEISSMPLKPVDFIDRMNKILERPMACTQAECESLLNEFTALAEKNLSL